MLHHFVTRLATATAAALALASGASALLIDDFSTAQTNTAILIGKQTNTSVSGPGILGGERDGALLLYSGASIALNVNNGAAVYTEAGISDGQLFFEWDGFDNSAVINQVGLGGVDLTVGGTQDALSVQILVNTVASTTNLGFLIHTDANNYSWIHFAAPSGSITQIIRFADFTPLAGTGANFTNIGAVSLFSDGAPSGQNIQFGTIQTALSPEPASGALLALGLLGLVRRRR